MLLRLSLVISLLAMAGCSSNEPVMARAESDVALFGPVAMRLHPIFTQVKDWTGDNKTDGVEALLEFQDQFGDPTKTSGRVRFELFDYQPFNPERRGDRIARWDGYLETLDEQRDRWNRTSSTYAFQLAYPTLAANKSYVLTAQFDLSNGGRFFAQLILEGQLPQSNALQLPPTTQSTTMPTTGPAPTSLAPSPMSSPGPATPPVRASGNEPGNTPGRNQEPQQSLPR